MVTWPCHVCGEERPDDKISVFKRDDSAAFGVPAGTVVHNIRYCNDRAACAGGASGARKPELKSGREIESRTDFEMKIG